MCMIRVPRVPHNSRQDGVGLWKPKKDFDWFLYRCWFQIGWTILGFLESTMVHVSSRVTDVAADAADSGVVAAVASLFVVVAAWTTAAVAAVDSWT